MAATGDQYVIKPLNLNTRVDEEDQVDTLFVFNGDSPANDQGTLTATNLSGLGMGTGLELEPGRFFAGGITYSNLEAINIFLGSGNDTFTVESTHAGSTRIIAGKGDDTVRVKTIAGHTTIETGIGDDTVTSRTTRALVDQITAPADDRHGRRRRHRQRQRHERHERQRRHAHGHDADRARHADRARGADALRPGRRAARYTLTRRRGYGLDAFDYADDRAAFDDRAAKLLFGTTEPPRRRSCARTFDVTYTITFLREHAVGPYRCSASRSRSTNLTAAPGLVGVRRGVTRAGRHDDADAARSSRR